MSYREMMEESAYNMVRRFSEQTVNEVAGAESTCRRVTPLAQTQAGDNDSLSPVTSGATILR